MAFMGRVKDASAAMDKPRGGFGLREVSQGAHVESWPGARGTCVLVLGIAAVCGGEIDLARERR